MLQKVQTPPNLLYSLVGRAKDEAQYSSNSDENTTHNPALLEYLPFSKTALEEIVDIFHVHTYIVRVINRGFSFFSRTYTKIGKRDAISISSHTLVDHRPG